MSTFDVLEAPERMQLTQGARVQPAPSHPALAGEMHECLVQQTRPAGTTCHSSHPRREQDSHSKQLQVISGAPVALYWLANALWDGLAYAVSATAILLLIAVYHQRGFSGERLWAALWLLAGFGPAGLAMTYLLHFLFTVGGIPGPVVRSWCVCWLGVFQGRGPVSKVCGGTSSPLVVRRSPPYSTSMHAVRSGHS